MRDDTEGDVGGEKEEGWGAGEADPQNGKEGEEQGGEDLHWDL